jgi:SAM-dependent methyltransferase
MSGNTRLSYPSAGRNRDAILQVLRSHLPPSGLVLEIASGTGQHVAYFAAALPGLQWQPTDPTPEHRASIDAWAAELGNVRIPLALDATVSDWPIDHADVVLCINMIHIAPWAATLGLVAGACRVLGAGGLLILYGPFRRSGMKMEPGNAAFDADLRDRNPEWGVREIEEVARVAADSGFGAAIIVPMPANNHMLLFRRVT